MKKITQFQCEKCLNMYSSKNQAQSCEKNHREILSFAPSFYYNESQLNYPSSLVILFDDKTLVEYDIVPNSNPMKIENIPSKAIPKQFKHAIIENKNGSENEYLNYEIIEGILNENNT